MRVATPMLAVAAASLAGAAIAPVSKWESELLVWVALLCLVMAPLQMLAVQWDLPGWHRSLPWLVGLGLGYAISGQALAVVLMVAVAMAGTGWLVFALGFAYEEQVASAVRRRA